MPTFGELFLFGLLVAAIVAGSRLNRLGDALGALWRPARHSHHDVAGTSPPSTPSDHDESAS